MIIHKWIIPGWLVLNLIFNNVLRAQEEGTTGSDSSATTVLPTVSQPVESDTLSPFWNVERSQFTEPLVEDAVDQMKLLPGVSALDFGTLGAFSPLIIRGSSPPQSLILLDEVVLEDPILGSLNSSLIPIHLVEQVNFTPVGSVLPFGVYAPFGTVRFSTYTFAGERPYSRVNFSTGDWGYSDIGIIFGLPISPTSSFELAGNREEYGGFKGFNNGHEGSRIIGKLFYHPRPNLSVKYSALINKHTTEIPAPLLPDFFPFALGKRKERRFDQVIRFQWGNIRQNHQQLTGYFYFSRLVQESFTDSLLFRNKNLLFELALQHQIFWRLGQFAYGGQVKFYDFTSALLKDHADRLGQIFMRQTLQPMQSLIINTQLRFEKHDAFSGALLPSAQVLLQPGPKLNFWLGFQQGRRYPTFSERYWKSETFLGQPSLHNEKTTGLELGSRWQVTPEFLLRGSFYLLKTTNWISRKILPNAEVITLKNAGTRTIHGVDFSMDWRPVKHGKLGFVTSYMQVKESEIEKQLEVPEFQIYSYFQIGHSFFENYVFVTLRLDGRFFGKRHGLKFSDPTTFPVITNLSETAVVDGKISLHFTDATIFFGIDNLFDNIYQLVPGFFVQPRAFRFGIEWEFLD